MSNSRRYCSRCGRAIRFAFIGGKVRPIHEDGRPCETGGGGRQRRLPFPAIFTPAFDSPVESEACRCAGAPKVFVIHHGGGVTRFDRVEWQWELHRCGHTVSVDFGLDYMARRVGAEQHEWVRLVLVAAARQFWVEKPFHYVAVVECASPERKHVLKVRCEDGTPEELLGRARVAAGALAAMTGNGGVKRLLTASGYGFESVDDRGSADELGIPEQWLGGAPENIRI